MNNFFDKHPKQGLGNVARQQAIQIVLNNVLWANDRVDDLLDNLPSPL
jgi:hypothetical protein